jgi:hypothetical protein
MSRAVLAVLLAGYAVSLSFLSPERLWGRASEERAVVVPPRGEGDGVLFRRREFRGSPVELLDIDLATPGVSVRVHAREVVPGGGAWRVADSFSLPVWCRLTGAVGGINGGFFGAEVEPGRKEVIGLAQVEGKILSPAARYRSRGPRRVRYAHSALGLDARGRPRIDWVSASRRDARRLLCFDRPEDLTNGRPWATRSAVAGGPRLIHDGQVAVSARGERLASPGARSRSFVGYASPAHGRPRLVLATASALSYRDAADFLAAYFRQEHNIACEQAMCLDGGTSAQLAYRQGSRCIPAGPGALAVPTCVLVHDELARR